MRGMRDNPAAVTRSLTLYRVAGDGKAGVAGLDHITQAEAMALAVVDSGVGDLMRRERAAEREQNPPG